MIASPLKLLRGASVVVLSAGHGNGDPGACEGPWNEASQCIDLVNDIAAKLIAAKLGCVVVPHSNGLAGAIGWINERYQPRSAVAFEVHRDSAESVRGKPDADLRCGIYTGLSAASREVGEVVRSAMVARGAHKSSWSRPHTSSPHKRLAFITRPRCPSFILELAFMQGRNDSQHLRSLAGIAAGSLVAAMGEQPINP